MRLLEVNPFTLQLNTDPSDDEPVLGVVKHSVGKLRGGDVISRLETLQLITDLGGDDDPVLVVVKPPVGRLRGGGVADLGGVPVTSLSTEC